VTIWGALAGGVVGTVVLTSTLRIAQAAGWTRMDIPLLIGTMFSDRRGRASVIGYAWAIFRAVGHAGWAFGAVLGLVHAMFAGGALVNTILPAVHPRMGTPWSDAEETPILEPPGFLLSNYGRRTAITNIIAHVAYGAIIGGFATGLW